MVKKNRQRQVAAAIMLAALRAHIPGLQARMNKQDVIVLYASTRKQALHCRLFSRRIALEAQRLVVATKQLEMRDVRWVTEVQYGLDNALGCLVKSFKQLSEFGDISLLVRENTQRGIVIRGSENDPQFWQEVIDHLCCFGRPRKMRFKVVTTQAVHGQ